MPAKYATSVRKGTGITFSTKGGEDKYRGTVYAVEPQIDPSTRTPVSYTHLDVYKRQLLSRYLLLFTNQ